MVSKRMIVIAAMSAAVVGMVAGNAYAQQSATPPGERFVLTGVVHVEGGRGVAWLQEPTFTNNQIVTVRPGDSVGPYRVTKILEDKVELVGPGGTVFVPLAGAPGTVSVAASPETKQPSVHELPPHPALKNPEAIVISRGDPRRNFPASDLLIGAGAQLADEVGKQSSRRPAPQPAAVVSVPDRGRVAAAMQAPPPELPAHPALQNPNATVIPPGDPRQEFPAGSLLIGAGARVGGTP